MKKALYIASLILIISCQKEGKIAEAIGKDNDSTEVKMDSTQTVINQPQQIPLESFPFPAEVNGCSCYFGKTKQDFENQKYIYIDDYGNTAYLKVNGKEIKFPMKEGDFDPENFSKTLRNEEYTITISGQKLKEKDEVMLFEGTMTVENKSGEKTITSIYGECGC